VLGRRTQRIKQIGLHRGTGERGFEIGHYEISGAQEWLEIGKGFRRGMHIPPQHHIAQERERDK
jgi:hypothetical protein